MIQAGLARKIDYWLGIPACFFFSLLSRIIRIFKRPKQHKPRKIIFIELSEIGSAVLSYPALKEVKKTYPQASIYFWIFEENRKGIELLDIISRERIITIRSNSLRVFLKDFLKSLWLIHKEKIDTAVDMELFSRFSALLAYFSLAQIRVGFDRYAQEGLYRGNLHTHKVIYNPYLHISGNFVSLVKAISKTSEYPLLKEEVKNQDFCLPQIKISRKNKDSILEKIKNFSSSTNLIKQKVIIRYDFIDQVGVRLWPESSYLQLIDRLSAQRDILPIAIGKQYRKVCLADQSKCINLTGLNSLEELLALFSISDLLVSHDGGIIHLASLTEIKIIALFGPESPYLYSPLGKTKKVFYKKFRCSPCLSAYNHRSSFCRDNRCMQAIGVDEVYRGILGLLG